MDINAYLATLPGVKLGKRGEVSQAIFENQKKCPEFGKKDPDCIHHWVKFFIQDIVLRVFWRKKLKIFHCGAFLCFWRNVYQSALVPQTPALKNFWLCTCTQALMFFAKRSILNVWECSEYACFSNCSVNCTVTLWYVLHQAHSEQFWHIQHSCFFFRYMPAYSIVFSIIKAYLGIFSTLCNPRIFITLPYSEPWHI